MAPTSIYADQEDPDAQGRWQRPRSGRRWLKILLILLILPLLLGAGVALLAGRPLAFDVVRRMTARKFPEVRWIEHAELARWREDPSRAQPVVLDARTQVEYAVSHLGDAVRIDPYRPLLRPLRGFSKDTAIVVYGSAGYRGGRVADWLRRQGYSNVFNLSGGIFQWANVDRPLSRNNGPTTEVHPYDPKWGLLLESKYRIEAPPVEKRSAAP
ncbi:MAG: rhodanese-like domain-containing protein [Gemmatimonadales bacterium]